MNSFLENYSEEIELTPHAIELLENFLAEWGLLSDLAMSDLIMWVPTWHGKGYFAVSQIRPATIPSLMPDDLVGDFLPMGRNSLLDRALAGKKSVRDFDEQAKSNFAVIPLILDQKVIGLLERRWTADGRGGRMEAVYLDAAEALLKMIEQDCQAFASLAQKLTETPRVGDGFIRLDRDGRVVFASPNAQSAFRRLGLNKDLTGEHLANLCRRIIQKQGLADEALSLISSGKVSGEFELENKAATVTLKVISLIDKSEPIGALVLVHDVTLLRKKDRALLSKDATIREVHHRVKNNLQTIGSLLRLQVRRSFSQEVKKSLLEAERRVNTIAIVHETLAFSNEEKVNFDDILKKTIMMLNELSTSLDEKRTNKIIKSGDIGYLKSKTATALAMVLVEVLHNAFTHGQPASGNIELNLFKKNGEAEIIVKDFGPGLNVENKSEDSLGLDIINSLVKEELGGEIKFSSNQPQGLLVQIRIKTEN